MRNFTELILIMQMLILLSKLHLFYDFFKTFVDANIRFAKL